MIDGASLTPHRTLDYRSAKLGRVSRLHADDDGAFHPRQNMLFSRLFYLNPVFSRRQFGKVYGAGTITDLAIDEGTTLIDIDMQMVTVGAELDLVLQLVSRPARQYCMIFRRNDVDGTFGSGSEYRIHKGQGRRRQHKGRDRDFCLVHGKSPSDVELSVVKIALDRTSVPEKIGNIGAEFSMQTDIRPLDVSIGQKPVDIHAVLASGYK